MNLVPGRIAGFFDGLELLEPGVVSVTRGRPDPTEVGAPHPWRTSWE
ncbi:SAM-dependent methyltransferase [Nocardiopsis dassonvillei]